MNVDIYINDQVKLVRSLYQELIDHHPQDNSPYDFLKQQAETLWEAYKIEDERVLPELTNFHPELIGASSEQVFAADLSSDDVDNIILDEYGFDSWDDVKNIGHFDLTFEKAVNTLLSGNITELEVLLGYHPHIVREPSQFGHKAGIIHYLGSNGIEIWRQIVPSNSVDLLKVLLSSGADPNQKNNIYGGSDLKSLIESGIHPYEAGLGDALVAELDKSVPNDNV